MRNLLFACALLLPAGGAHGEALFDRYLDGLLYAAPHEIVYRTARTTTVFFETSHRITAFAADPARGIYAVTAATESATMFYLFDVRRSYGALMSRKRIAAGENVVHFAEIDISPDGRHVRRKDGSIDHLELSYYDVAKRRKSRRPPAAVTWSPGPWIRETFRTIAYREPDSADILYSIQLSTAISDIRLFPDRNETFVMFYGSRPPALYSLNPFEPIDVYPRTLSAELARGRPIDWCPNSACLLLAGRSSPYLFFPATGRRVKIPHINGPCDDLRSRHAGPETLLIECRSAGNTASVLTAFPEGAGAPEFERLPVPNTPRVYYQWKNADTGPWLKADLNKLLEDTRREEARLAAQAARTAWGQARLSKMRKERALEQRREEEQRRRTDTLIGKTAACVHAGILGLIAVRLRRKG